jgi:hypothetical protein
VLHVVRFSFHPEHATTHARETLPLATVDAWTTTSVRGRRIVERRDLHLATVVDVEATDEVSATFVFDDAYAEAHRWALDDAHLALVHATVAAKLYDGGCIALDDTGIGASLRWPGIRQHYTIMDASGQRARRAPGS